jgi:hypothetical protein|tara:strand:+ start:169 stop:453 length:285 start_codon:yes stop_codon:yes gene_type:complete
VEKKVNSDYFYSYQVQDIPKFVQKILLRYGEKKSMGFDDNEYLRFFSNDVIDVLRKKDELGLWENIEDYIDCYLIHSEDGKTIITMGKYLNHKN